MYFNFVSSVLAAWRSTSSVMEDGNLGTASRPAPQEFLDKLPHHLAPHYSQEILHYDRATYQFDKLLSAVFEVGDAECLARLHTLQDDAVVPLCPTLYRARLLAGMATVDRPDRGFTKPTQNTTEGSEAAAPEEGELRPKKVRKRDLTKEMTKRWKQSKEFQQLKERYGSRPSVSAGFSQAEGR